MSTEERTRDEVLNCLIAHTQALTVLVQALQQAYGAGMIMPQQTMPPIEREIGEAPPAIKKARAKKGAPLGPALTEPELPTERVTEEPAVVPEKMADIKPVKPGKTLADLRAALQDCITKNGMGGAKERLAPFLKLSDVPDAEIEATITRLVS